MSVTTFSSSDGDRPLFSKLDRALCDLALGNLTAESRRVVEAMIEADPELQRKYARIKELYAEDIDVEDDLEVPDDEADEGLWAPWTPWVRSEAGTRMMQAGDYGPEDMMVDAASLSDDVAETQVSSVLQGVDEQPAVAEHRFAPRGGSAFGLDESIAIQCRDLPVSDARFRLRVFTETGLRLDIAGDDEAWHEQGMQEPETGRVVRRASIAHEAREWLRQLGCPVPAPHAVLTVRFVFEALNGVAWVSGDEFRIAGGEWLDQTEARIEEQVRTWQDAPDRVQDLVDLLRHALEEAQWGLLAIDQTLEDLGTLTDGPLCAPIRRALLYYQTGLDSRATQLARNTLAYEPMAGNLLRSIHLLSAERGGLS